MQNPLFVPLPYLFPLLAGEVRYREWSLLEHQRASRLAKFEVYRWIKSQPNPDDRRTVHGIAAAAQVPHGYSHDAASAVFKGALVIRTAERTFMSRLCSERILTLRGNLQTEQTLAYEAVSNVRAVAYTEVETIRA
jgi:hypothetical protein